MTPEWQAVADALEREIAAAVACIDERLTLVQRALQLLSIRVAWRAALEAELAAHHTPKPARNRARRRYLRQWRERLKREQASDTAWRADDLWHAAVVEMEASVFGQSYPHKCPALSSKSKQEED